MKHHTLILTGLLALCLAIPAAFAADLSDVALAKSGTSAQAEPPVATPATSAAEIKISHDWPGYTGPERAL